MDIPPALVDEVKQGRVVLLLGAGASIGATNAAGQEPPDGTSLARMLADRFLGGLYADLPLQIVAELAISETDLFTVQEYIREIFAQFNPAAFHELVPTFRWHGLATTNYDLVIERAYDRAHPRAQSVVPFRLNTDRILDLVHLQDTVLLLKLHGCISVTRDERTPLILTTDQYVLHRQGRSRLFETLFGWGHERPIVFIGHSMQDPDLRQLLLELAELGTTRPRFYLVTPAAPHPLTRMWEARRVSVLEGTFEDFLVTLDALLPGPLRMAEPVKTTDHAIASRFSVRGAQLSSDAMSFLMLDADFVHAGISVEELEPRAFYRGINKGWAGVERQFDVKRGLSETLLADVVLGDEVDQAPTQVHVIKAEAGAGKTICLRRIAWDAATQFDRLCVWLNDNGHLSPEVIGELAQVCQERVYLFVDNAAEHVAQIQAAIARARREGFRLTIFTAERVNAWNMQCDELDPFVTSVYRLPYLRASEINDLVDRLERHNSLGILEGFTADERVEAFERRAGRQLLVALHEATQGRPFEDILVDEFQQVQPLRARSLYLSVCVLNRLSVPVRAGLIARVHDIPFNEFQEELFKPLEHVVTAALDTRIKDYLYSARHPEIAQIVFERILSDPAARYDEYIRMITKMNLAFDTDRVAFFQMLRARALMDLFPDHSAILEIYRVAAAIAGDEAFLYHQQAIFEMRRVSGNLNRAAELLGQALALAPGAKAVMHSMAELELSRADRSKTQLEREHHRDQAIKLASPLRSDPAKGAYGYHTLLKVTI